MKNNTGVPKHYLQRAIQTLPQDNALTEVRALLKQALSKMEHTEKKREVREEPKPTAQANWNELLKQGIAQGGLFHNDHPSSPKRTIDTLNQMIAEEHRKLAALAQNTTSPGKRNSDGDDDLQTIHG